MTELVDTSEEARRANLRWFAVCYLAISVGLIVLSGLIGMIGIKLPGFAVNLGGYIGAVLLAARRFQDKVPGGLAGADRHAVSFSYTYIAIAISVALSAAFAMLAVSVGMMTFAGLADGIRRFGLITLVMIALFAAVYYGFARLLIGKIAKQQSPASAPAN